MLERMQSMSDAANDTELVDYYGDYGPKRFRGRAGEPPSHRLLVKNIKVFDGLVVRIGHTTLINPRRADARLLELAAAQRQQRQPQPQPPQPEVRLDRPRAEIDVPPVRRGRGRPPGSRNRPRDLPVDQVKEPLETF
jgi:hypothetical protein